ncbi:MAG: Aerotolerance protein BatA [uncultured Acidimicrobiales bacterium]|uniref:Aerotolerance protein BatA n=1 Tax=uncultured Acidimicrobiales bacterium TaxID=310071 RepID=A0A6J4HZF5_9ACTN|nr:MAG: Aerotolerance protein BatA [uncultured Acidimicrobiales bacterium]
MSFLEPLRLVLLLAVGALVVAYVVLQLRRRRIAVRFSQVDLLASVAPRHPGWRRHLPAGALVGALILLVLAFAQPVRDEQVARREATVILAIDTSISMEATDVAPSRMAAAQQAAEEFAGSLPDRFRLGLVSFAGTASVIVPPTTDHELVRRRIAGLQLAPSTAIGEAIHTSLAAALEGQEPPGTEAPDEDSADKPAVRIVVLSDGATTVGRSNASGAAAAEEAGVPVSTIAFGTDAGVVQVEGRQLSVPVDRDALREVANATGGRFFEAPTASELQRVYSDIGTSLRFATEQREITALFAGVALLLALLAAAGSLLWSNRLV